MSAIVGVVELSAGAPVRPTKSGQWRARVYCHRGRSRRLQCVALVRGRLAFIHESMATMRTKWVPHLVAEIPTRRPPATDEHLPLSNVYDLTVYRSNLREEWPEPMRFVRVTTLLVDAMVRNQKPVARKRRRQRKGAKNG